MSENFQPHEQESSFAPEVKPMPFVDKLTGIFASPSEVFENLVKSKISLTDWLIPMLILILISIVSTFLKFGNEQIRDSLIQFQEKRFEQLIEEGKMTEEQAEIARERLEQVGASQKIFSTIGILIGVPISFLIVSLVYFLLGKFFLGGNVEFMTVFSIYSLSSLITSVEVIVSTILAFITGSFFANVSPTIFMEPSTSKVYILASKFNFFTFWQLAVFAIGLAKAFDKKYIQSFGLVFGVWVVWVVLSLFLPFFG